MTERRVWGTVIVAKKAYASRRAPVKSCERADLESVISDLTSGQYSNPVRVVAFNAAEHWAEDAPEDIARQIMRRLDVAGIELPSCLEGFIERHLGPERRLTLWLA